MGRFGCCSIRDRKAVASVSLRGGAKCVLNARVLRTKMPLAKNFLFLLPAVLRSLLSACALPLACLARGGLFPLRQEASNALFCPSRKKFYNVILGCQKHKYFWHTIKFPDEISHVTVHLAYSLPPEPCEPPASRMRVASGISPHPRASTTNAPGGSRLSLVGHCTTFCAHFCAKIGAPLVVFPLPRLFQIPKCNENFSDSWDGIASNLVYKFVGTLWASAKPFAIASHFPTKRKIAASSKPTGAKGIQKSTQVLQNTARNVRAQNPAPPASPIVTTVFRHE